VNIPTCKGRNTNLHFRNICKVLEDGDVKSFNYSDEWHTKVTKNINYFKTFFRIFLQVLKFEKVFFCLDVKMCVEIMYTSIILHY
jgi:hypothetical protein